MRDDSAGASRRLYRLLMLGFTRVHLFRMRLGGVLNRTSRAKPNMPRQVFVTKTVLAIFVCCSVWLPLTHECYESLRVPAGLNAGSVSTASGSTRSHELLTRIPPRTLPAAPGSCLACLWSHHLFLGHVTAGLGIPRFLMSEALPAQSPDPLIASQFDSASKRGPPAFAPPSSDCAL